MVEYEEVAMMKSCGLWGPGPERRGLRYWERRRPYSLSLSPGEAEIVEMDIESYQAGKG